MTGGATKIQKLKEPEKLMPAKAMAIVESWLAACEASAPPANQLHFGVHIRRSLPALEEVLYGRNS